MGRVFHLVSAVVMIFGIGGIAPLSRAVAQDATPAGDSMTEEGVTFEPLGFAYGLELPSPGSLIAVRVTIEPGAVSSFDDTDPTSGMLIVESGTFTAKLEAALSVSRAGGTFGETEDFAIGDEASLSAGDVMFIPGSIAGEIRNDGAEPAVGTVFLIVPGDLGALEATPAA
jgi:quercetin dioxygenase-like cupin family protein